MVEKVRRSIMLIPPISFGNQVELLHQGQVVLDVPVVGDAPVGDAVDVGGDEIDRLALALGLLEAAGEVATKVQVHDDAITGPDNIRAKVPNSITAKTARSLTLSRSPRPKPLSSSSAPRDPDTSTSE